MKCYCNTYPKNIRLVDEAMAKGGGYSGKFFKYCPWCGLEIDAPMLPLSVPSKGNMQAVLNRSHIKAKE